MRVKNGCSLLSFLALTCCLLAPSPLLAADATVQWLNHLDFLAGDDVVAAEFNAGLGGLEISASDTGDRFVEQGLQVSPGFLVSGVRVCYALSSAESFINQISLAQLQDPVVGGQVLLDDLTSQSDPGPVCVDSAPPFGDPIDPALGPLNLRLGATFADTGDNVVILGVGLLTIPDPNSPVLQAIEQLQSDLADVQDDLAEVQDDLQNHSHTYLTGKGVGHNNVTATTGSASFSDEPPQPAPLATSKKKTNKKSSPFLLQRFY